MTEHDQQATEHEEPSPDEKATGREESTARAGGRGVVVFALLIAVLAAAAAGWTGWHTWQSRDAGGDADRLAALSGRVDRLGGEVDSLRTELATAGESARSADDRAGQAAQTADDAAARFDEVRRSVSDLAGEVADLQESLSQQDRRLESIAGRLEEPGDASPDLALSLAQAEYLVHTAYRMLELERDPERAARAMSLAAERLQGLQAPGLTRARESVASELEALRGVPRLDRDGLAARLAGLADTVASLPLRGDLGPASAARAETADSPETPPEERGWWQATRDFMGEYFTVRRTDETGTSLPAPGTLSLMRDVLRLGLEQARLALLRGDAGLYRQSLERADGVLAAYFAEDDPAVASARRTLAALLEENVEPRLPELGEALEALRAVDADTAESR